MNDLNMSSCALSQGKREFEHQKLMGKMSLQERGGEKKSLFLAERQKK